MVYYGGFRSLHAFTESNCRLLSLESSWGNFGHLKGLHNFPKYKRSKDGSLSCKNVLCDKKWDNWCKTFSLCQI